MRHKFILLLFFLFPVLSATVVDAGSTIYALLGFVSFFHCRKSIVLLAPKEKHLLIGFAVFFLVSCLSLFMTEDFLTGIKRFERYGRLLLLIPIYLMLRKESFETGKAFLLGSFMALFVMLGQAWYQVEILDNPFAHGAYHKIILGNMTILFTILIFIGVCFYGKNRINYLLAIIPMAAGFYTSLLSGTRTAWFFVPVVIVTLLILYRKRLSKHDWKLITLSIAVTSLLILIWPPEKLVYGLGMVWVDLADFSQDSFGGSLGTRLVMWRNSLLIFKESPLFGTGVGDFMHDSIILLEKGLSYKNDFAVNSTNAHSIYFMLLAEGGLVGLILLVFVLFILPYRFVYGLWKKTSDKSLQFYTLLAMISIIAFAWFGVSESWVNRNPMVNAYCMTLLVFVSSAANRAKVINELQ